MGCAIWPIPDMSETSLLCVDRLSIRALQGRCTRTIVDSISFDVDVERVALVGESGSGKSLTARALMGLLGAPLEVSAERLDFAGRDLRRLTPKQWAHVRGSTMSLILQDPRHALNPVLTIGCQLDEALRLHGELSAAGRRERIMEMLQAVGMPDPRRTLAAYAHQLSGGMGQRAMLAMMLINGPRLLIADDPSSALDAALRGQVLDLILNLVETHRMGLLMISHDLPLVAGYCDRVLVMYRGQIVDRCAATELAHSRHPYTRTLWSCQPSGRTYGTRLPVLDRNWQRPGDSP